MEALRSGLVPRARQEQIEGAVRERGVRIEDLLREERQRQAANQVTVSNCVTSLRLLSAIDWPVFYETTSLVEALLRSDPAGVYALQDFATRQVQVLTQGSLDESPSVAPNGKLIIYASEVGGRGILAAVSSDGRVKQRLTAAASDVREPAWGPLPR